MVVSSVQSLLLVAGLVISIGVKVFAVVQAIRFSAESYEAAAKLTKVTWVAILALGLVAQLLSFNPMGILNVVFLVAALVFLADVRPALLRVKR